MLWIQEHHTELQRLKIYSTNGSQSQYPKQLLLCCLLWSQTLELTPAPIELHMQTWSQNGWFVLTLMTLMIYRDAFINQRWGEEIPYKPYSPCPCFYQAIQDARNFRSWNLQLLLQEANPKVELSLTSIQSHLSDFDESLFKWYTGQTHPQVRE